MSMYRSRLRKIFFFFAASDSGAHRHMDVREFLYMLKVLGITDHRNLPLEEAARVVVTWAGFIGDPNKHKVGRCTITDTNTDSNTVAASCASTTGRAMVPHTFRWWCVTPCSWTLACSATCWLGAPT